MSKKAKQRILTKGLNDLGSKMESVRKLWSIQLPHVNPPAHNWIAQWCMHHTGEAIEAGIARVLKEFPRRRGEKVDHEAIQRYAIALMEGMRDGIR